MIIQRAVEEEFDSWLGRARYERKPNAGPGKRNGFRPRHVQTGEGELRIEIPQVREAAIPFVSKLFPKWHCKRLLRTDPLKALVDRRVRARPVDARRRVVVRRGRAGKTSKSTVATICAELHERFGSVLSPVALRRHLVAVPRRDLPPVRPSGPKEGVICAWGITETGARELVCVRRAREARRTGSSSAAI